MREAGNHSVSVFAYSSEKITGNPSIKCAVYVGHHVYVVITHYALSTYYDSGTDSSSLCSSE